MEAGRDLPALPGVDQFAGYYCRITCRDEPGGLDRCGRVVRMGLLGTTYRMGKDETVYKRTPNLNYSIIFCDTDPGSRCIGRYLRAEKRIGRWPATFMENNGTGYNETALDRNRTRRFPGGLCRNTSRIFFFR